jgi:hypothetical protein
MDLSSILQTALGLAAMYWLLATACSFFLELINSMRNVRGKALTIFIYEMAGAELKKTNWGARVSRLLFLGRKNLGFADNEVGSATWVGHSIVKHPLVRSHEKPKWRRDAANTPPSYLPADVFAKALIDSLRSLLRLSPEGLLYLVERSTLNDTVRVPLIARLQQAIQAPDTTAGSAVTTLVAGLEELSSRQMIDSLLRGSCRYDFDKFLRNGQLLGYVTLAKHYSRIVYDRVTQPAAANASPDTVVVVIFGRTFQVLPAVATEIEAARNRIRIRHALLEHRFDASHPHTEVLNEVLRKSCPGLQPSPSTAQLIEWLRQPGETIWTKNFLRLLLNVGITRTAMEPIRAAQPENASQIEAALSQALRNLSFSDLRAAVASPLVPAKLRDALTPLINNSAHDVDEARKSIETWYDGVMDRATGWYKRHCMILLAVFAGIPVAMFNIDTIQIGKRLLTDAGFRSIWEQAALKIYSEPQQLTTWVRQNAAIFAVNRGGLLPDRDRTYGGMSESEQEALNRELRAVLAATATTTDLSPTLWAITDIPCDKNNKKKCGRPQVDFLARSFSDSGSRVAPEVMGSAIPTRNDAPAEPQPDAIDRTAAPISKEELDALLQPIQRCDEGSCTKAIEGFLSESKIVTDPALARAIWDFLNPYSELDAKVDDSVINAQKDEKLNAIRDALFAKNPSAMAAVSATWGTKPEWLKNALTEIHKASESKRDPAPSWLDFPIGTHVYNFYATSKQALPDVLTAILAKLGEFLFSAFGLFLTVLMISLGAPFWFELISKIANVRGAGGKPPHADS